MKASLSTVAVIAMTFSCGVPVSNQRSATPGEGEHNSIDDRLSLDTPVGFRHIVIDFKEGVTQSHNCLHWSGDVSSSMDLKNINSSKLDGKDQVTMTNAKLLHFNVETTIAKDRIEFDAPYSKDNVATISISGKVDNDCRNRKSNVAVVSENIDVVFTTAQIIDMPRDVDFMNKDGRISLASDVQNCPINYVLVPVNSELHTDEFCVMKYEAKNVFGKATSQAADKPWVNIARGSIAAPAANTAIKACKDLGARYDLISNAQWQALARNIESVPSNWSTSVNTYIVNTPGDNSALNRGYSDGDLAKGPLPASADNDACFGTGRPNCSSKSHGDFTQKRTHTLSNNAVIWDVAGNVWEWVKDDNSSAQGADTLVSQLTAPMYNLAKWGPAGNYTAKNSGEFGGLGGATLNHAGGGIIRGGVWFNKNNSGVFASGLLNPASQAMPDTGFRCVVPPLAK